MIYPTKTVYLAGPITGLTHDESRYGWRKEFASLMPEHILCNSPMRGKEFLADFGVLTSGDGYPDNAMSSPSGVTTRDFNDVTTSDAMIACFIESGGRLSGGTFMEYGFAYTKQIPIIGVGDPKDPNMCHLMAQHVCGYQVATLEEAALLVTKLLTPGL